MHLGSINPNNWLPLLAFRKRLIVGEVAPESSTPSVASTAGVCETSTARGIRNAVCRPTGATNKQQILDLVCAGLTVSQISAQIDVVATTVHTNCAAATTGSDAAVVCSKRRYLKLHGGGFQGVPDGK